MISQEDKEWMSKFMTDMWNFIKTYGDRSLDESKAADMLYDSDAIIKKYNEDERVLCMLMGFMNGLEREVKKDGRCG